MKKVAHKSYLPANRVILDLIAKHPDFKVAYSISGTALDQFKAYAPEVLDSFHELAATGAVEFLAETYYHSLSSLFDPTEFKEQVKQHETAIRTEFKQKPRVFRNTELIYNNDIAQQAERMGYRAILAEGWDSILSWRSPNYVYAPKDTRIKLLLKNYRLSDDIAFRFSDKHWNSHPLTADKFAGWLAPLLGDTINLFMDYETFGEHQWADTGIFNFLTHLPTALKHHGITFHHPSDLLLTPAKEHLDIPHTISWADLERDTSAWLGNTIQQNAAQKLYSLRANILATRDKNLITTFRKLTTSDHFYYMCTKWFSDGDVHKYFNPYDSPYDAFITYMNIIQDLELTLKKQRGFFANMSKLLAST